MYYKEKTVVILKDIKKKCKQIFSKNQKTSFPSHFTRYLFQIHCRFEIWLYNFKTNITCSMSELHQRNICLCLLLFGGGGGGGW